MTISAKGRAPGASSPARLAVALALLAGITATGPARANDTSAALAAGGLQFVTNDQVQMQTEDLFLSEEEVRVHYVFRNSGKEDVRLLVAFPMPDITLSESPQSIPVDAENFLDFKTTVDGKPVATKVEQKALAFGIDRTEMLQKLKIPVAPHLAATTTALDALPQAQWKDLIDMGLARVDEFDAGKGVERHLAPLWTLKTTYYWMQTFPAGRDLIVDHRYRPSVGSAVGTVLGMSTKDNPYIAEEQQTAKTAYCLDASFLSTVDRATKAAGKNELAFSEASIHYILTTGANWSGPIADFTLTVDKGAPQNLVSFCGTGVKKISPTQFQMKAKDFTPTKDLAVVILKPYPKK